MNKTIFKKFVISPRISYKETLNFDKIDFEKR